MLKSLALIALTSCAAAPAAALTCFEPETAKADLKENGYKPVFWGDTPTGETLTFWISPEKGWIAMILTADGMACIGGIGEDWGVAQEALK